MDHYANAMDVRMLERRPATTLEEFYAIENRAREVLSKLRAHLKKAQEERVALDAQIKELEEAIARTDVFADRGKVDISRVPMGCGRSR